MPAMVECCTPAPHAPSTGSFSPPPDWCIGRSVATVALCRHGLYSIYLMFGMVTPLKSTGPVRGLRPPPFFFPTSQFFTFGTVDPDRPASFQCKDHKGYKQKAYQSFGAALAQK